MHGIMSKRPGNTKNTDMILAAIRSFALFATALLVMSACGRNPRNLLVVLDTSGSMIGPQKTMDKVRGSLPRLLETVQKGDSVTLVSFDEAVRTGETIRIDKEEDKKKVLDQAAALRPEGMYTDMVNMVAAVREKSAQLEKSGDIVIVILTDGMDDPRPGSRRDRFNLEVLRSPEAPPIKEYYIYYVNLGTLKDEKLEAKLKSISPQVKVVQGKPGGSAAEQTGIDTVSSDIRTATLLGSVKRIWQTYTKEILIGAGALLGLIALILFIRWFRNRYKAEGKLSYYEDGVSFPMKTDYTLNKLQTAEFTIGATLGSNVRVRGLGTQERLSFRAKGAKGRSYLVPSGRATSVMKVIAQKQKGLISTGDRFKIGNFIFEYDDGKEKGKTQTR